MAGDNNGAAPAEESGGGSGERWLLVDSAPGVQEDLSGALSRID